jgi:hypothetical protein
VQVVQEYAYDTFGPVAGQGWTKDAETYLYMLRVVIDMHLSGATAAATDDAFTALKQEALQSALKRWVLEAREVVGALPLPPRPPSLCQRTAEGACPENVQCVNA